MKKIIPVYVLFMSILYVKAQKSDFIKDRKIPLNESGSNFIKFSFLTQAWIRTADYNPGTTIDGTAKSSGTDIGIRRTSFQVYGQLTDRIFIYSQVGLNNFNNISDRKQGFFVHDAYGEYALDKTKISLGMGLSGWSGLSRFASPSVGSQLGIDAPLYQQQTNDATDQFLRKLSVFAKGKLGRLDYRVQMAQPMSITKMAGYNPAISTNANFSSLPPKMQYNAYFQYQFKDQESNQTPYMAGTYLGKKSVFNIGGGFIYQKNAIWRTGTSGDTIQSSLKDVALDIFYDAPLGHNGKAISLYGNVTHSDFGKNYTRNAAAMNPANGNNRPEILNGPGVAFPMYGTGTSCYIQAGYKFKEHLVGNTTFMPYAALQHSNYERLHQSMNFWDIGVNWLLAGHMSKFTISYQNHPVYTTNGDEITTKNAALAQYQVSF
ncbi:hypothetical protein [Elizabethkingia anophelis]|uniref:hypothetical protein n=1 Tax=Elizabethkingia anophelis TaxID=1117645 RepID=UPI0038915170